MVVPGVVMGKAKKRSFQLGINDRVSNLSREDAVNMVVDMLKSGDNNVYGLVTLFGFSAEELLEAGASYESVVGIKGLLK